MKKILTILLLAFFIVGCESKEPFYLNDEYYGAYELAEIDNEKIDELIKNKESFMVFVYMPGCSSCASFRPILTEYLEKNKIKAYSILYEKAKETIITDSVKYTPSLVIFKAGKVISYLDSASNEHLAYFASVDGLTKWVSEYILMKEEL